MNWKTVVKEQLKALKVSRQQIADEMGISIATFGHWLNGRNEPSLEQLDELCRRVGVTIAIGYRGSLMAFAYDPEGSAAPAQDDSCKALTADMGEVALSGDALLMTKRVPVEAQVTLEKGGEWSAEAMVTPGDGSLGSADIATQDLTAYCIAIQGDALFPVFRDGWMIAIEPRSKLVPGEFVYVETVSGNFMVKELLWQRAGTYALGNVTGEPGRVTLAASEIKRIHYCYPVPAGKRVPAEGQS